MKKALIKLSTISAFISTTLITVYAQAPVITSSGGVGGAGTQGGTSILNLLALAQTLVARLVPFLIGLAVVVFFYFLVVFIVRGSGDAAKHSSSLKGMGMAILALFVMVSIWGLVGFLGSFLGVGQGGTAPAPGIPLP